MITVSDSWKEVNQRFLLPETFIEISCGMTDVGVRDLLEVSSTDEAVFSNAGNIIKSVNTFSSAKYATMEHNLWLLDGSRNIVPNSGSYNTPGYVSGVGVPASVVLSLPEVRQSPAPGLTITWSSEYGEYAVDFTVTAKNGDTVIATTEITGNNANVTEVDMELVNYDSVVVEVTKWSLPNHRVRIDQISFGHVVIFSKNDVLSFSHEQHGCLNSGEIPKNSIEFTLNNTDDRWNPNNPTGIGKYLSERQQISVRYGIDINGVTEWIPAGKWYLSEWSAPSNGLEAFFSARDVFEFMMNEPYTGDSTGSLSHLLSQAFSIADLPDDFAYSVDPSLGNYIATLEGEHTVAEVVQLCANAGYCVVWQDRNGVLNITPLNETYSGYSIVSALSYSHPEVTLTKPLKAVAVSYGEDSTYSLSVGTSGETQTVDNPLIDTVDQAEAMAAWVRHTMESRKSVTGEFRADPRLDLFDVVTVESKYGIIYPVAITNIKYTYTGAFKGSYTGKVINTEAVLGQFILGASLVE